MKRALMTAVLLLAAAGVAADALLIDSMDELRFHAPKEKGRAELAPGRLRRPPADPDRRHCPLRVFTSRCGRAVAPVALFDDADGQRDR